MLPESALFGNMFSSSLKDPGGGPFSPLPPLLASNLTSNMTFHTDKDLKPKTLWERSYILAKDVDSNLKSKPKNFGLKKAYFMGSL